jgi:hypothetical protein
MAAKQPAASTRQLTKQPKHHLPHTELQSTAEKLMAEICDLWELVDQEDAFKCPSKAFAFSMGLSLHSHVDVSNH